MTPPGLQMQHTDRFPFCLKRYLTADGRPSPLGGSRRGEGGSFEFGRLGLLRGEVLAGRLDRRYTPPRASGASLPRLQKSADIKLKDRARLAFLGRGGGSLDVLARLDPWLGVVVSIP